MFMKKDLELSKFFEPDEILCDIEKEKFILGSMLLKDGFIIPTVSKILTADDFYRPEHRIIFTAILKIYSQQAPANLMTLIEELRKENNLESPDNNSAAIPLEYVFMLTEIAHTTAYAEYYAQTIKDKSIRRQMLSNLFSHVLDIQAGLKSIDEIVGSVHSDFKFFSPQEKTNVTNVGNYLTNGFLQDIEIQKEYYNRHTGFSNIDDNQIFCAGLYVLGATPATGKTTFAWQLAENLALNGENCIFCSYEMSRLELSSKTVARELFIRNSDTNLSAAEIRRGGWTGEISTVLHEFSEAQLNLRIIELRNETIDDLLNLLRPICNNVEKAPIVFVDYLQIIPSTTENTKLGIDDTVRKLKLFQRETNTTFIVISSFNRSNYFQSVSFESFKESGNIEYTADVVWALQLYEMTKIKGGADISVTRQKVNNAKKQVPRQIILKCLKNRQGNDYECFFNYFSKHDYFVPCSESDFQILDSDSRDDDPDKEDRSK
jgi:replicative DNA helicase